jgi:hypothetical protein
MNLSVNRISNGIGVIILLFLVNYFSPMWAMAGLVTECYNSNKGWEGKLDLYFIKADISKITRKYIATKIDDLDGIGHLIGRAFESTLEKPFEAENISDSTAIDATSKVIKNSFVENSFWKNLYFIVFVNYKDSQRRDVEGEKFYYKTSDNGGFNEKFFFALHSTEGEEIKYTFCRAGIVSWRLCGIATKSI